MSAIRIENVSKVYGNDTPAVTSISLEVQDGEFLVLVGPSGCGKSTLLRMIAGLESVTSGGIYIGGEDARRLAPKDRDIAMVFQDYALYPHMTIRKNLAFGLHRRGLEKAIAQHKVTEVAELLGLQDLLDRKPAELSGGQRQRVAIGRAIVREPRVFLMDEPLSNLDAKLRVSMRAELARLHRQLAITTVYVTHDQVEAMTLGQRVAVMHDGTLQQLARPQELFRRPVNLFVAGFIGSPAINLVPAAISRAQVSFAGFDIPFPASASFNGTREVVLGIRPTDFSSPETNPGLPRMSVRVEVIEELGSETYIVFGVDAPPLTAMTEGADASQREAGRLLLSDRRTLFTARIDAHRPVAVGEPCELAIDPRQLHFFDASTGAALGGGHQ